MKLIKPQKNHLDWIFAISLVVVMTLAIVFVEILSKSNIVQNVKDRAFMEVGATAELQSSTLQNHIEEQYQPLKTIATMLEDGATFASKEMKPILSAVVDTYTLCMLGFADLDGNVIAYNGNQLSSISDRAYFQKIVSGETDRYCEYLAATKSTNEPRILFSVPAYRDGKIIGVLFCAKEVKVLEESLFEHDKLFDDSSIIFICSSDGKILASNKTACEKWLSEGVCNDSVNVFEQIPDMENMYCTGIAIGQISFYKADAYATLVPLSVNDWMLGCIIDEEKATKAYANYLANIQSFSASLLLIFCLALGYILVLVYVLFRKGWNEAKMFKRNYENYKMLFREINCTVIEHNHADSTITSINGEDDPYGIKSWKGSMEAYEKYKKQHPEFDFDELEKEVNLVLNENKTHSFESIISLNNKKIHWVRIILVPIIDENRDPQIFGVILDTTDMHKEFDDISKTFEKIPGGIHRCYLSDPIHLEYFSEGLAKMLGYTKKEIIDIITPERIYTQLIYPEDRPIFSNFVKSLAANGGIQTCEYRMIRKDGSLLLVSDTMDAKLSSSGIMYGYSVVMGLNKHRQVQKQLEQELEITRQQLEQARIKNSNSQMQPHFLYNALASIREIVLEDPQYASELIYDFTIHLRACIRSMASDNLVPFSQELENIKAYVNIEKMRFGKRLNVEYDCSEIGFDIIPLSIQPLVENAIRHGIYERGSEGGSVKVISCREGRNFVVRVEDNGIGFDFDKIMDEVKTGKRDSAGLCNLIFRLETLQKAHVTVESKINIGTRITVMIPKGEKQ